MNFSDYKYSEDLVNHIKPSEGEELQKYSDLNGYNTIGYGHNLDTNGTTFPDGSPIPDSITSDQADTILRNDMDNLLSQLKRNSKLANLQVTQGQGDAIMDFAWGGIGTFYGSTLYKYITGQLTPADGDNTIADEFKKWVYAGSPLVVQPGLVKRRQWEADRWTNNY